MAQIKNLAGLTTDEINYEISNGAKFVNAFFRLLSIPYFQTNHT